MSGVDDFDGAINTKQRELGILLRRAGLPVELDEAGHVVWSLPERERPGHDGVVWRIDEVYGFGEVVLGQAREPREAYHLVLAWVEKVGIKEIDGDTVFWSWRRFQK